MQIAVGSIFRNSTGHIQRYADQVNALRAAAPQHTFRPVLVEGDSSDDSWGKLNDLFPGCVAKREHGGPVFGSVDSPQRYRQFSFCYEGVLERLTPEDDIFLYVEGDLLWDAKTILELIQNLDNPGVDMVAPFCFYQNRNYDVWAFRAPNGDLLGFYPPYHVSMLEDPVNELYPLSAAGSCIAMKGEVARRAHFVPDDFCIVAFCWNARKLGYSLWLNPALRVHHPE